MSPEEHAADLLDRGYAEVAAAAGLAVGMRVRHGNEQYASAVLHGTGNIERIFHKPDSAWSREWGGPDVELIVKRDKPRFGPNDTHAYVANYHVIPMENAA